MKKAAIVFLTALAVPLPAQDDPREKMKEILEQVAHEMAEIDKLLQETSRNKEAAKSMKKNLENLNKLLDNVGKSQERVIQGIDDLLKQAEKMKGKPGDPMSGKNPKPGQKPSEQDGQGQPKDGKNRRQKRQLRDPGQQQPGDQQQQQQSGKERNGQEKPTDGKNVTGGKRPDAETEKIDSKKIQDAWGDLPDYLKKHGRGSMVDVPEKYRKYLDALTKKGHKAGKSKK
ncbi:MAG: hypothetical protein VX951_02920 [Planctomycetota bacterium]|nr:hypothetical protein [Planctomycetota bacterium]